MFEVLIESLMLDRSGLSLGRLCFPGCFSVITEKVQGCGFAALVLGAFMGFNIAVSDLFKKYAVNCNQFIVLASLESRF